MKLFFDTETTGKGDFKAPYTAPHQPHIVQLGALLTEDNGDEVASLDVIIKPEGWTIPAEVAAIHGITTEIAERCGIPLAVALLAFNHLTKAADQMVAHNDEFDHLITRAAFHRIDKEPHFITLKRFCTMKASTNICRIPGFRGGYKWPTLIEAHKILVGEPLEDAHTAMADVRGCKRVFYKIPGTIPATPPAP